RSILEGLSGSSECDAAIDYAQNVPTRVITYMLRLPEHEGDRFRGWIHSIHEGIGDPVIAKAVSNEIIAFLSDHVEKCRNEPRRYWVGFLFEARLMGQPLSDA